MSKFRVPLDKHGITAVKAFVADCGHRSERGQSVMTIASYRADDSGVFCEPCGRRNTERFVETFDPDEFDSMLDAGELD